MWGLEKDQTSDSLCNRRRGGTGFPIPPWIRKRYILDALLKLLKPDLIKFSLSDFEKILFCDKLLNKNEKMKKSPKLFHRVISAKMRFFYMFV